MLNAAVGFDQLTLTPTYELRLGVPGSSAGLNIAARLGLQPEIIKAARAQLTTQTADIGAFLDQLHDQLTAASIERETLQQRERELSRERARLEVEGRVEQKARTKELEAKLNSLIEDFAYQLRETVKAIDDKALAQKIARDSDRRMATLRREFSEQFNSTVVAHTTRADRNDPAAQPHIPKGIKVGDLVKLKSLGRQARVDRIIDPKTFEVSMGQMKMRVAIDDIADVESLKSSLHSKPLANAEASPSPRPTTTPTTCPPRSMLLAAPPMKPRPKSNASSTVLFSQDSPASASSTVPAWASFAALSANISETIPTSPPSQSPHKIRVAKALPKSNFANEHGVGYSRTR